MNARIPNPARRFARDPKGSITVELVIVLPLLFWALVATVVFFDGFRSRNQAQMAAQTVADLLSRETSQFTAAYLEGMNGVFDFLADSRFETRLRISSVIWNSAEQRNALQWSYGTRDFAPLPMETFRYFQEGDFEGLVSAIASENGVSHASARAMAPRQDLPDRIPPVLPGEALIMVESFAMWWPFAQVGIGRMRFDPVVVIRPRFAPWINLEGTDPIVPESDYEVAVIGYVPGNETLPEPIVTDPDPVANPVIVNQDFSTGAAGWSQQPIGSSINLSIGQFLGPFGGATWFNPVNYAVNLGSTPRAAARIEFDLIIIDSWDGWGPTFTHPEGDILQLLIDGMPIFSDSFANWSGDWYENNRFAVVNYQGSVYRIEMLRTLSGTSFAGNPAWNDSLWRVTVDIQAPPANFAFGLRARLSEGPEDEAFGIDNFKITAFSGDPVPASFIANPAQVANTDIRTHFLRYNACPNHQIAAPWLTIQSSQIWNNVSFARRPGGTVAANSCGLGPSMVGFIRAQPNFVLNYTNDTPNTNGNRLRIRLNDGNNGNSCDSTLLIRDPSGQYWFNDDFPGHGFNAGLNLGHALTGTYHIWLGRWQNGDCTADARVIIERY